MYSELTRHHFATAASAGELSGPGVWRGMAGSWRLGTWVQFDVAAEVGAPEIIAAARFLAFGCPHVIAVADWVAAAAVGRPTSAGLPQSVQALRDTFDVPIEKLGRLLIVEDAWLAAMAASPQQRGTCPKIMT